MQTNKQHATCRKGGLFMQPDDVKKYPVITRTANDGVL